MGKQPLKYYVPHFDDADYYLDFLELTKITLPLLPQGTKFQKSPVL